MSTPTLGALLHGFFEDYLKAQKGLSLASVRSYRDALRLFLHFVGQDKHCKLTRLALADLTSERVLRFLDHLEQERGNHTRSRNQRLAALRTFFEYLVSRVPEMLLQGERVARAPTKRAAPAETFFLERDQVQTLFAQLPSQGPFALRDRTLLTFLYNTGARVQEVADLRVAHLELRTQHRVHLHGKGDKWRICPLWEQTASLLKQLLDKDNEASISEHPVFTSRQGRPLTRSGIYKIVCRHAGNLSVRGTDARPRKVSPHVFRHTTAVHLLEAGVDVNVIRAWLGHVSLETTNRYAEINIQAKEAALKLCEPSTISEGFPSKPVWRDDPALLKWLQSL